jgi:hypothetical protein
VATHPRNKVGDQTSNLTYGTERLGWGERAGEEGGGSHPTELLQH